MSDYDAGNTDTNQVRWLVCDKTIVGGTWFARIRRGPLMVAMRSPRCVSDFVDDSDSFLRRMENPPAISPK